MCTTNFVVKLSHLSGIPALNKVSGHVPRSTALYIESNVVPRHPRCGRAVNEVCNNETLVTTYSSNGVQFA